MLSGIVSIRFLVTVCKVNPGGTDCQQVTLANGCKTVDGRLAKPCGCPPWGTIPTAVTNGIAFHRIGVSLEAIPIPFHRDTFFEQQYGDLDYENYNRGPFLHFRIENHSKVGFRFRGGDASGCFSSNRIPLFHAPFPSLHTNGNHPGDYVVRADVGCQHVGDVAYRQFDSASGTAVGMPETRDFGIAFSVDEGRSKSATRLSFDGYPGG